MSPQFHRFRAAFPGTNGLIAFVSFRDGNGEIYVMNADGSGPTNLSNNPAFDLFPNWQSLRECDGLAATIYVQAGIIVGGPNNGKPYAGKLKGTTGDDVILGTPEADTIDDRGGHDRICGMADEDKLKGGQQDDVLLGGEGDDKLKGGGGDDLLMGEGGADKLRGGDGTDTLTGGADADNFKGGNGTDTATDFNPGEGDSP